MVALQVIRITVPDYKANLAAMIEAMLVDWSEAFGGG